MKSLPASTIYLLLTPGLSVPHAVLTAAVPTQSSQVKVMEFTTLLLHLSPRMSTVRSPNTLTFCRKRTLVDRQEMGLRDLKRSGCL
jgi:hypothetical protein